MLFSALVNPLDQINEEPRWRQWMAPLAMAAVVLALSGALWRSARRPAVVVSHPALLGARTAPPADAPAAAAPAREADQPFSLDDLARGLLALSQEPTARERLARSLGSEVGQAMALRRSLELGRVRRDSLATAMGRAAAAATLSLDRRQVLALASSGERGAPAAADPWAALLEALKAGGPR